MTTIVKVNLSKQVPSDLAPGEESRIQEQARKLPCELGGYFSFTARRTDGTTTSLLVVCQGEFWLVSPRPAHP